MHRTERVKVKQRVPHQYLVQYFSFLTQTIYTVLFDFSLGFNLLTVQVP